MKERLIVMNGQSIVQKEISEGQWKNEKVDKATGIKPGIYNIYLATQADKSKTYTGVIVHADKEKVYQQIGKTFIKHNRSDFNKIPDIGSNKTIAYNVESKISVTDAQKNTQGLSR